MRTSPDYYGRQAGISLVEVLIAVLVLAVGVLGAAALQLNALRFNASAAQSTQASFIAYDMLDRMRANPDQLGGYAGSIIPNCNQPAAGAGILAEDLADFARAVGCLPDGSANIAVADNRATVSIAWSEARIVDGEENTRFVVSSVVRGEP